MEELVEILHGIKDLLESIDNRLTSIESEISDIKEVSSSGFSDVCDKLDEIKGIGIYDSLSDVCDKLDTLDATCGNICL